MNTNLDESSNSYENDDRQNFLPLLTDGIIQRAQEGLAAARDLEAKESVEESLANAEAFVQGNSHKQVNGELRRLLIRTIIHSLFRVKVENRELIPQVSAILAPNHLSHFDPFLILSEIGANPFYYILGDARTLYNKWWKRGFLSWNGGTIPLDRLWKEELAVIEGAKKDRKDLIDLAQAIAKDVPDGKSLQKLRRLDRISQGILSGGNGILIFPEGKLGTAEGELLPLKKGVAIYALRAGVPIVPVAIIGSKDLYFRKPITLRFGKPLVFPQSLRPKSSQVQAVLDALQAALIDLLPQNYQEPQGIKLWRNFLNRALC
ncbi:lysophospholipid acyltransferase family protein [Aerosakkonemataceae cyanobacterium BLCC-F50]|uniref:Lysophospholipid acyltransferase family protein n=1 Tax=Floridaenema flaviceps BLCC-F50 TaxID=3153642 RepID=A0ABV4XMD4_9CYAN